MRPLHNTPSAASLSRFGLGHVRKHTPFALTLSSLHLGHSAKSLPKKHRFFGERPFCKGLLIYTTPIGCRSLWELAITSDALSGSLREPYASGATRKGGRGQDADLSTGRAATAARPVAIKRGSLSGSSIRSRDQYLGVYCLPMAGLGTSVTASPSTDAYGETVARRMRCKVSAHLKQMCENGTSCNIL